MKKLVLFITCLLIATSTLWADDYDFSAYAPSGQTLYYYYNGSSGTSVTVTYPNSNPHNHYLNFTIPSGNLVIPSSVSYNGKTYAVTGIGNYAFVYCTGLTSVTIPNSVTRIGEGAFFNTGWWNNQPDSIIYLDGWCLGYKGSKPTGTLTILEGTKGIADNAFDGCSGLTAVTIPNSVTSIGEYAFSGCTGLTSITIENGVTSIGDHAFLNCSGLTGTLTIPNSVTSIEDGAFGGCEGLTSVTIPNSVKSIGEYAFSGCSGLTTLNFNAENCTNMGFYDSPFRNCSNLKTLTIGENVKTIPEYAFYGCSGLTGTLTIPNSVTSIGEGAFYNCTGLTSVTIPNSVTSIGEGAFYNCTGLTSVTIPNSVTSIGRSAFNGCSGLTSVIIPNSVTSIGNGAFARCTGLTGSLTIPNSVTSIGDRAFYGCEKLTSITIPNSVTNIGDGAFADCSGLTSITIPKSVISIGSEVFAKNIITVVCLATTPPSASANTFANYNAALFVPDESVYQYKYHEVWGNFKEIIPLSEAPDFVKQMIKAAGNVNAIAETAANAAQIFSGEKSIIINNAANANVAIYDAMGRIVVKEQRINTNNEVFAMPQRGMYIVRMGKAAKKVFVK